MTPGPDGGLRETIRSPNQKINVPAGPGLSKPSLTWVLENSTELYKESRTKYLFVSAVIFFFALALIVYRAPSLFYSPRFWAEEATVYLRMAYVSPLFETLIAPHQGYYIFWTNLAGILAAIAVPLDYAPAVTTGMALVVLLVIIVAILVNESSALDTPYKKAIASLSAVVVGATGEIWLTSTNSHHIFPLLVFLILIDSKRNPVKRRFWYVIAAIAGLSGPQANFLTPLFLLRYWQKRERGDLVLFMILICTSFIEVFSILYSLDFLGRAAYFDTSQKRLPTDVKPMSVLGEMLYFGLKYPIFGNAQRYGWIGAPLLVLAVYLARSQMRQLLLFTLSAGMLTVLGVLGSLDMAGGARYAYVPSVILAIQLLTQSANINLSIVARAMSGVLLLASLLYWTWTFRSSFNNYLNPNWPTWSTEVKEWRLDPMRKLQVWPMWENQTAMGLVWSMQLPAHPSAQ